MVQPWVQIFLGTYSSKTCSFKRRYKYKQLQIFRPSDGTFNEIRAKIEIHAPQKIDNFTMIVFKHDLRRQKMLK